MRDIGTKLILLAFRNSKFVWVIWLIFVQVQHQCPGQCPGEMPCFNYGLEDMYNGLVKHLSGGAKTDFWTGQKPRRDAYANYLSVATYSQGVPGPWGGCLWTRRNPAKHRFSMDSRLRILLHVSRWWSTKAQNLWLPAKAETCANNCWNFGLWTIIIGSSVTRWHPMKAANSRGVYGTCSVCSHKFKAPMQASDFDEALTTINPGLRRMSISWFRDSRTASGRSEGSLSLQRRVRHLCTR